MSAAEKAWVPPFCANEVENLECPKCDDGGRVFVREEEYYLDSDTVEAFCGECHVLLEVSASVEITFSDVEVVDV